MYRTILVPLENSATDLAILSHIRGLARLAGLLGPRSDSEPSGA